MSERAEAGAGFDEQVWQADDGDADRWLALAQRDPVRFLWSAHPDRVPVDDPRLQAILRPSLQDADLPVALPWLRHPGFFTDAEAVERLEAKLDEASAGAGWLALAEALSALRERGQRWKTARILERLLDRYWLNGAEAVAIDRVVEELADSALLAALCRHEPWRTEPTRLEGLVDRCPTPDLIRGVDRSFGLDRESSDRLRALLWRGLARRDDPRALEPSAALLAKLWDQPVGAIAGLDVVLGLQRVHGDSAVPDLVAVFLSGAYRGPVGELIQRWLRSRPEAALSTALDTLPEWMPRFEARAMNRLCWGLIPKLDPEARLRIRDLAEIAGGTRGDLVIEELDGLG